MSQDTPPTNWAGPDRRNGDQTDLILHRLLSIERGMENMTNSLTKLAENMARLVLVEERIGQVNEALGRAFKEVDSTKARIAVLEQAAPLTKTATDWVIKLAQALALLALGYVAVKTGLKP